MHDASDEYFDGLAADARWHAFTSEERRIVDSLARRWGIQRGERVLEPGCGSGRLTEILAAMTGPRGGVFAFDCCPAFTRLARRRGLPSHVTVRTGRVETLRLAPRSFDHVVCFNVFPHLVPCGDIARRLAAVLKPGGYFWIAHTASRGVVNAVHRSGPPYLREQLLPPPAELARLLRSAGLRGIEIDDRPDCFLAKAVFPRI